MPTTLFLVENATVPEDPRVWAECTTMRDQGWNVVVICPRGSGARAAVEVIDEIQIFRFDGPNGRAWCARVRHRVRRQPAKDPLDRAFSFAAAAGRCRPRGKPSGLPAPRRPRAPKQGAAPSSTITI